MIPVLIVGYKRVDDLKKLVLSCVEAGANRIYIAIDGTKAGDTSLRNDFQEAIDSLKERSPQIPFSIWMRDENLGSAISVITAIDWAFQKEKALAILEDDLVVSPNLLKHFSQNLNQLSTTKVMLTGSNVFTHLFSDDLVGITHFPVVWGWATTKENWNLMREGIFTKHLTYPSSTKWRVKSFLETGRSRALAGHIDAWDVPLSAWMFAKQSECLVPAVNLVSNRGFGADATHTKKDVWPLNVKLSKSSVSIHSWNDSDAIRNLDSEMIKKVLQIKMRHALSHILFLIKAKMFGTKINLNTLEIEVEKIFIPQIGKR